MHHGREAREQCSIPTIITPDSLQIRGHVSKHGAVCDRLRRLYAKPLTNDDRGDDMGRPTDYDRTKCDLIGLMGNEGEGMAEAISALGVSKQTFYTWQEKHPEFLDAVKAMRLRSQAWWEMKGRLATFGGVDGFNATSFIFNMKNRFADDWKDKHEVAHDVADPLSELLTQVAANGKRIGV